MGHRAKPLHSCSAACQHECYNPSASTEYLLQRCFVCTQGASKEETCPGDKRAEMADPTDGGQRDVSNVVENDATGPEGALTAQEPRLAAVLGEDAGSGRGDRPPVLSGRAGSMRPAASGELDARERGVAGGWNAERAASWPTAAHKYASSV